MSVTQARELLSPRFDAPGQGWLTAHLSQPAGRILAAGAFWLGISPNGLTYAGLLVSLIASALFAFAELSSTLLIMVVLLWQLAFAFDCADGQLARGTARGSLYGAWLDVSCDFVRQSGVTLALAARLGHELTPWQAHLSAFCFLAGAATYLYSCSMATQAADRSTQASGWGKRLVASVLDTPLFLLLVPLLALKPPLLALFAGIFGLLLLARAWRIGLMRLARPSR